MTTRLFLIILLNIGPILCGEWQTPTITEPVDCRLATVEPKEDKPCFNKWSHDVNDKLRQLFVEYDEEQEEPIIVAKIHCQGCTGEIQFGVFEIGNQAVLGPELKETEPDVFSLIINNRLDFETEDHQAFMFHISLKGTSDTVIISIKINDIDDNPPKVIIDKIPCVIKENFAGEVKDCTLTITDPDTIHTVHMIKFILPEDIAQHFKVNLYPEDDHKATAKLEVIEGEELDFETMPVYYFELIAQDGGGNNGTAAIMIKVEDVNDEPPRWVEIFAMESFEEHTDQKFTVYAIDGDLELNEPIKYTLTCPDDFKDIITYQPNEEKADIIIKNIDREHPAVENNANTIQCDMMAEDSLFNITQKINFIIIDINDNNPCIVLNTAVEQPMRLREEQFTSLDKLFTVQDKDEGKNAQFKVELRNSVGQTFRTDFTEPFQVIPDNGYRFWEFTFSVSKPAILDYDKDATWREFSIIIHSEDKGEEEVLTDKKEIKIELINLNDEEPIFEDVKYIVDILETAGEDTYILNVLAKDADVGDKVTYEILDTDYKITQNFPNGSATIKTARNNVFDYEKIKIVYIQIIATDTLIDEDNSELHSKSQQITINVIDVNDEQPRIFLPFKSIDIKEHSDVGTIVTVDPVITAEDVDTEAKLQFDIIWDNCRASKLGSPVDIEKIKDVFSIETKYPANEEEKEICSNPNLVQEGCAVGVLTVKNNVTLDYEIFDTILLNIKVTDTMQTILPNTDEGMMTITLIDINDNAPEFVESTIESNKNVVEHSADDILIATIQAIDIDGPNYNQVSYYIESDDDIDTELIYIDKKSGELRVKNGAEIDADWPDYVYSLNFTVIASDGELDTPAKIQIKVEDINDEVPFLKDEIPDNIQVTERKSDEDEQCLYTIDGDDHDRDDPHNIVSYYINNDFNQLHQMLKIDSKTGEICAHGNIQWTTDITQVQIYFILQDNLGGQPNERKFNFTATILDIDNNAPVLPNKPSDEQRDISENSEKDKKIFEIIATDKDEPCTPRTKIDYSITKIMNSKDEEVIEKIFDLKYREEGPQCLQIADLIVNADLKGYYGKFMISIHAENPETPENFDDKDYEINVEPFNFESPSILYPTESLFVLKNEQTPGAKLKYIGDSDLADFEATDNQNDKFEMVFSMIEGDQSLFELQRKPDGNKNKARLTVKINNPDGSYDLKLRAEHKGIGNRLNYIEKTIKVEFLNEGLPPTFPEATDKVKFVENNTDIRCQDILPAEDKKCDSSSVDCPYKIYYYILTNEEKNYFYLDNSEAKKPKICLVQDLDYEEQAFHYLDILASNNDKLINPPSDPGQSLLKLTVEVEDINDNPPEFPAPKIFQGALLDTDEIDTVIIELIAYDPDTVDEGKLRYYLDEGTAEISDESLDSVKNNAFIIKDTNLIYNQFAPTQKMQGFFTYDVYVFDSLPQNHSDKGQVKIYIISDEMRVSFKFNEDVDTVKSKKIEIEGVFSKTIGYQCTIDKFEKKSNTSTTTRADDFITEVKTHFVDNKDEPVEKETVMGKLDDFAIGTLRVLFNEMGLTLIQFEEGSTVTNEVEDLNYLLQILLIIVSVVLGTLCIILIVAFILRTRSLKKRLDAMTTNVFGSTKSDLNRMGISAPGTNRHAIEANPVWNEDLNNTNQFDTISQASGGSDLIGVEDQPDFEYNHHRASINPVVQRMYEGNEEYGNGFIPASKNSQKLYNDDDDDISSLPDSLNKTPMH